ncbi:MAG: dipeptide ABC transporter ATP-binding protein [Gammaproteobacteria bacterium]|nr:dipeptide ABC transporter ATP-binding protein [Gammaproteobacteria bacterium]
MSDCLLEAQNLSKHYVVKQSAWKRPQTILALRCASFALYPEQTLAIVGESGSGKTTLAKILVKMEPPSGGALRFHGQSILNGDHKERYALSSKIRLIFQNPYSSLNPRWRVFETLSEPLLLHQKHLSKSKRQTLIEEWLKKVELPVELARRYPHMLSGGQRQRIAIARALILHPEVVVADEPLSALDVSVQDQILKLLHTLKKELHVSYIFISHDLAVVRSIADFVCVMYFGKIVEEGDVYSIFTNSKHPYTKALLESTPRFAMGKRMERAPIKGELPSPFAPPLGCPFHTRCPYATQICRVIEPELRKVEGSMTACHHAEWV